MTHLPFRLALILSLSSIGSAAHAQEHVLSMDPVTAGLIGDSVFVSCYYDNLSANLDIQGYAWGVCVADPSVAEFIQTQPGIDATGPNFAAPSYYSILTYPEGWTVLAITDFFATNTIPPGSTGNELAVAEYVMLTNATTEIDYCDDIGQAYILVADTSSTGYVPLTSGGILGTPFFFPRGDADGNGSVVGLIDGLFILNYQFNAGSTPQCLDAADVDGNGLLTGLLDALYLLNYQFAGGTEPPTPGPLCGTPAEVVLGCDQSSCP